MYKLSNTESKQIPIEVKKMLYLILVIILLLLVIISKLNTIIRKLKIQEKIDLVKDIKDLRDKNIISEEEFEEKLPIALDIKKKENLINDKKAILNLKKHGLLSNYELRYKLDLLNLEYDKDRSRENK